MSIVSRRGLLRGGMALLGASMLGVVVANRASAEEAQANGVARIKARGKLIAGVKFDTPPFGFLDDQNEPVGFDIDIVRKIGEHLGVPASSSRSPRRPASRCWSAAMPTSSRPR